MQVWSRERLDFSLQGRVRSVRPYFLGVQRESVRIVRIACALVIAANTVKIVLMAHLSRARNELAAIWKDDGTAFRNPSAVYAAMCCSVLL